MDRLHRTITMKQNRAWHLFAQGRSVRDVSETLGIKPQEAMVYRQRYVRRKHLAHV